MKRSQDYVWCADCIKSKPPIIEKAAFLVLVRTGFYCLSDNGYSLDIRLTGVCKRCLDENKNQFQKDNKVDVDVDHPDLVLVLI